MFNIYLISNHTGKKRYNRGSIRKRIHKEDSVSKAQLKTLRANLTFEYDLYYYVNQRLNLQLQALEFKTHENY